MINNAWGHGEHSSHPKSKITPFCKFQVLVSKFQVYFIISSNCSPRAELQDKITLHNNISLKKDTSKHVYTQQNINNIKIFKNTHIAL